MIARYDGWLASSSTSTRDEWRGTALSVATFAVAILLVGCDGKGPTQPSDQAKNAAVSEFPLRVWVVTDIQDAEAIRRKWQGETPQPIEIRELTIQELLGGEKCRCDVLIYPSRLSGELVSRGWVLELPSKLTGGDDSVLTGLNKASAYQAAYNQRNYALPLGCDVAGVFVSDAVARESEAFGGWNQLVEDLPAEDMTISDDAVDRAAIVDRYLAIASSISSREAKYGLLFDLPDMVGVLNRYGEFEEAATMLLRLAQQTPDGRLAVGSHVSAWETVSQSDAALATVLPLAVLPSDLAGDAGEFYANVISTDTGSLWNTGHGLNVSLAEDCSQTAQAIGLVRWLAEPQTRTFLGSQMQGITPASPGGTSAARWKAIQSQQPLLTERVAHELRLPLADQYRSILADELTTMLKGQSTPKQMVNRVAAGWSKINRQNPEQGRRYQESLGLRY
ncbi:MAG TPA: hypothetical protein DDW52_01990 [Planctomycetaceae bacterium]|nr:hypothetical protein [Planctomycetaceae bacterium]